MMIIKPLAWHEENLITFRENYNRRKAEIERELADLVRWEAQILFRATQIEEAKRRGITEYDSEKFMVPRKKRTDS